VNHKEAHTFLPCERVSYTKFRVAPFKISYFELNAIKAEVANEHVQKKVVGFFYKINSHTRSTTEIRIPVFLVITHIFYPS
jgi:hypothetical protein